MPVESDDELRSIPELDTIAVVGCSTTPGKAAHDILVHRPHGLVLAVGDAGVGLAEPRPVAAVVPPRLDGVLGADTPEPIAELGRDSTAVELSSSQASERRL